MEVKTTAHQTLTTLQLWEEDSPNVMHPVFAVQAALCFLLANTISGIIFYGVKWTAATEHLQTCCMMRAI